MILEYWDEMHYQSLAPECILKQDMENGQKRTVIENIDGQRTYFTHIKSICVVKHPISLGVKTVLLVDTGQDIVVLPVDQMTARYQISVPARKIDFLPLWSPDSINWSGQLLIVCQGYPANLFFYHQNRETGLIAFEEEVPWGSRFLTRGGCLFLHRPDGLDPLNFSEILSFYDYEMAYTFYQQLRYIMPGL